MANRGFQSPLEDRSLPCRRDPATNLSAPHGRHTMAPCAAHGRVARLPEPASPRRPHHYHPLHPSRPNAATAMLVSESGLFEGIVAVVICSKAIDRSGRRWRRRCRPTASATSGRLEDRRSAPSVFEANTRAVFVVGCCFAFFWGISLGSPCTLQPTRPRAITRHTVLRPESQP